jgi:hypothetical protein
LTAVKAVPRYNNRHHNASASILATLKRTDPHYVLDCPLTPSCRGSGAVCSR